MNKSLRHCYPNHFGVCVKSFDCFYTVRTIEVS